MKRTLADIKESIIDGLLDLLEDLDKGESTAKANNPYGDGHCVAERIMNIIEK
ncbi:MAG: hypothetical protein NT140_06090 [Deltaproteobacteria bacterium]|nr:hypothetical protein [Deltaproteobacteria bacterium]